MRRSVERAVRERAGGVSEYRRVPEAFDLPPFQVDHIIAQQHGGPTRLDNLALSCLTCNKLKGPNLASIDPETGRLTRLFHPRRDRWARHFRWDGPVLVGRTAVGRATVRLLAINDPLTVELRAALIDEGTFRPEP